MNEQDKKLNETRALAVGEMPAPVTHSYVARLRGNLKKALDIIARQDAERKEVCVGCVYKGNHNFYLQHFSENDELRKDRDRLAAECKAKDAELQKYRQAEADADILPDKVRETISAKADHMRELLKAEAEGRLHIAPCADGTDIYCVVPEGSMFFDDTVDYNNGHQLQTETYIHGYTEFSYGELDKDWFLTREAALAKEGGGE